VARIAILDPTAPPPEVDPDPGPELGALAGRRVGFRYDLTWRSFLWVMDEWTRGLGAAGAATESLCVGDGNRSGGERARIEAGLAAFAGRIDAGVLGLGN
jgi:hypothetical protein